MTSEIDKLKHFYIEDYSGIYFTDELNNGEEFLYTTIGIKDDKEVIFLCKYVKNKHIEACPNCAFNNYFCHGLLLPYKINKGWTPRPTIIIDCVEIEIAPDNWIMAVDANNTNLLLLNAYYNIQWKECSCLRGIRLEDVTVELEKEAYEEMRHNI